MQERPSVLKVAHLVCSSIGGAAQHVYQLIQNLPKPEVSSRVFMPSDGDTQIIQRIKDCGCSVDTLGETTQFSWSVLAGLRRKLNSGDFDIVHYHGIRAASIARISSLDRARRYRTVYTIHGFHMLHYSKLWKWLGVTLERALSYRIDEFICVAEADRASLIRYRIASPQNVTTIHNGVDITFNPQAAISVRNEFSLGDAPVILTVCRFHPQKDIPTLIQAFVKVRKRLPNTKLVLVGDGPLKEDLKTQVRHAGIDDCVVFAGMRSDVGAFYGTADVFCLSSRWEGTSLVVIEAMAASRAIVASNIAGIQSLITDGQNGFLVAPGDVETMARAIINCLEDPELRRRIGASARNHYLSEFTAERMTSRTYEIYKRLQT